MVVSSPSTPDLLREAMPSAYAPLVRRFMEGVERGDLDAVIDVFPRELVQRVTPGRLRMIFASGRTEIISRGGIERIDVIQEREDAETAFADIALIYGDASCDRERVHFVADAGEWRIDPTR